MSTKTWSILGDTTVAGGAVDLGNGNDQHAPMGYWSGYVYRHFVYYNVDVSGMASISSATLHMRSTSQVHVGFGSSPSIVCSRVTSSWTGSGGSEGSWSGSAVPKDSTQPTATSSGQTTTSMTRTENTWDTIDVTAIAQAWLAGSPNYGVRLKALSEASGTNTWEAYAQAGSYDSYITVVYTAISTTTVPTATPVKPLTGDAANLDYTAGSGWASPRPTVQWSFADPDTGAYQASYQVLVYNDSAGSPGSTLYNSGVISGAANSLVIPATFVEGNYYHWAVTVTDNTGLSATSATQRFRTRWGAAEYYGDLGATPVALSVTTLNTSGKVIVEYNSTTDSADPGASLGTWQASISSVTKRRYVRYRAWLLPSTLGAPSLNQISFTYSGTGVPTPDSWTMVGTAQATSETVVYGTKSLRLAINDQATQTVPVLPNTIYQLSGRIKAAVPGGTLTGLVVRDNASVELLRIPGSATVIDWEAIDGQFNSGSNTSLVILCDNTSGLGNAWFDALKLEASDTATPWMPSVIGSSAVVDANGIKVDATAGGTMRLTGSAGGATDIVQLGSHGLILGSVGFSSGSAFPATPVSGEHVYRTDLGYDFYYDGTRWLSSQLFKTQMLGWTANLSATALNVYFAAAPGGYGESDIYFVSFLTRAFVVAGGAALDASNKWDGVLKSIDNTAGGTTTTTLASVALSSGTSNVWRGDLRTINALMGARYKLTMDWTKTGTPGALQTFSEVTYRIVAT